MEIISVSVNVQEGCVSFEIIMCLDQGSNKNFFCNFRNVFLGSSTVIFVLRLGSNLVITWTIHVMVIGQLLQTFHGPGNAVDSTTESIKKKNTVFKLILSNNICLFLIQ